MTGYLCELCAAILDTDGRCTGCNLQHATHAPCFVCQREGLHAPGCTAQRRFGDAVDQRRPVAYGIRWEGGGRVDRMWDRDGARRAAVDHARQHRYGNRPPVEVFALYANGDTEGLGACSFDVGAGFVRWQKRPAFVGGCDV